MVGAAPFRQQIMQIAGVFVAAFVMAPVLTLLHENTPGGIGGDKLSGAAGQFVRESGPRVFRRIASCRGA